MTNLTDTTFNLYQQQRIAHWDNVAQLSDTQANWGNYYHQRLTQIYQFLITPELRIIELGCARGDLLAALKPTRGVGIDFSSEILKQATQRHPCIEFICADVHTLDLQEKFDIIILSDIVNDLWDAQTVFKKIANLATPRSRVILNSYSHLWEKLSLRLTNVT